MGYHVDYPHQPGYPADDEGRHPVLPGRVPWLWLYSGAEPVRKDEVEALKEICDGVPEADEDVKEQDPDDGEGGACLQEPAVNFSTPATPVAGSTCFSDLINYLYKLSLDTYVWET